MEFRNYTLVVEVTLTESSRQEAAEGEPVRRHVADEMVKTNKPVFGMFIAKKIDNNTAETFRSGSWYTNDGKLINLSIIPLTINEFHQLFVSLMQSKANMPKLVLELLSYCNKLRKNLIAPVDEHNAIIWRQQIEKAVSEATSDGLKE